MPQRQVTIEEVQLLLEVERAAQPVAAASLEAAALVSLEGGPVPTEVMRLIEAVDKLNKYREGELRLEELRRRERPMSASKRCGQCGNYTSADSMTCSSCGKLTGPPPEVHDVVQPTESGFRYGTEQR